MELWYIKQSIGSKLVCNTCNRKLRIRQKLQPHYFGMTFKFSPDAKVIVEPGSTLTLTDGTLLTSTIWETHNVAYTWQGVEVWGATRAIKSQNIMPLAVGKLTIKNNSIIEYAICGVRGKSFITLPLIYIGGIIVYHYRSYI